MYWKTSLGHFDKCSFALFQYSYDLSLDQFKYVIKKFAFCAAVVNTKLGMSSAVRFISFCNQFLSIDREFSWKKTNIR